MSYTIKILGLLLLVALFEAGCKKETDCDDPTNMDCSNYDPCYGQTAFTEADFKVQEVLGYGYSDLPYSDSVDFHVFDTEDTVCRGNFVRFSALMEADRYEWRIGSDPRVFTGSSFQLTFFSNTDDSSFMPTTLMVELKGFREVAQSCFPADTVVTVARPFTIMPRHQSRVPGTFRGVSSQQPDSTIEVDIFPAHGTYFFDNIPVGCPNQGLYDGRRTRIGYRSGISGKTVGDFHQACYPVQTRIRMEGDDILIEYNIPYIPPTSYWPQLDTTHFVFRGSRM